MNNWITVLLAVVFVSGCQQKAPEAASTMPSAAHEGALPAAQTDETRQIAKEAYVYGFPMVEMYKSMYEQAIEIVVREQRGSTSLLQRALGIGYGRASRLIDFMAEDGLVGGFNGSNAREVMVTPEEWEQRKRA